MRRRSTTTHMHTRNGHPRSLQSNTRQRFPFGPTLRLFASIVTITLTLRDAVFVAGLALDQNRRILPILFENDHLVVMNKPHNVAHHDRDGRSDSDHHEEDSVREKGLLTLLREQQQQQQNSDKDYSLYGVHRLDVVTSGLLVVAKTQAMARCLTQAFTDRHVVKYYTGLSAAKPKKKKQGWVQGYMQRGRRKSWYLSTTAKQDDKQAEDNEADSSSAAASVFAKTYFWTAGLGQLADAYHGPITDSAQVQPSLIPPRTLVLFRPFTGRTHQLRVASKSVGLPLWGDPLYTTPSSASPITSSGLAFPRTCLHATGIHIDSQHLRRGGMNEDLTLWSPPPFLDWWEEGSRPDVLRLLQKDPSVPSSLLDMAATGCQ